MKRDTRTRILVTSLLLFNENGEPSTTTNEIADEVDISPGNLYYHFNKKADIVDALLAEFQADARRVLRPPESDGDSLDDFWLYLHLLLEFTAAYRFLFRDMEALQVHYSRVRNTLKHFARGLAASFELHLRQLVGCDVIRLGADDIPLISRNLAVIALFSDRFDALIETSTSADDSALRVASSVLNVLKPFAAEESTTHLAELASYYQE